MVDKVILPKSISKELSRRAREVGVSVEEYLADLLIQDPDPSERVKKYAEASLELLEQAKEELEKGDLRQASEKIWGATSLIIKAYALAKTGKRLASHGELWEYSEEIAKEFGDWVLVTFQQANSMHINFYEGWATEKHIRKALEAVEKLVKTLAEKLH